MKHGMRNVAALLAFLAFAAVSVLTVGAQTPTPTPIGPDDLLESRPVYTPHSATYGATMGLITADADRFMSPLDFGALSAQNWFAYAGVDEFIQEGINFGFGTRLAGGKNYFGVAYSGNLINEVAGLLTNQSPVGFKMETEETGGKTTPKLVGRDGKPVPEGEYISNHNLHFLFGLGGFGIKLGFAEYIKGLSISPTPNLYILESSLKPSIEFGFNGGGFKAALRVAADFRQYEDAHSITTDSLRVNFLEPSAGITLGFNFSKSEKTLAELGLVADGVYRMYGFLGDMPKKQFSTPATYEASSITDLRTTGSLGFTYRSELNEQFTLGFNAKIGGGFDTLSISQSSAPDSSYTSITVTPDVSAGVSYSPWKDHFALNAGLGLQLFSIDMITASSGTDTTSTVVEVPTVRLAIGTTVNFTENTALDLLIAARNIVELTNTKFTMLFSVKK